MLGHAIRKLAAAEALVCLDVRAGGDDSIHVGSFTDSDLFDALLPDCSCVIHTAALHGTNLHSAAPAQFIETNVAGLTTLLEACLRHRVRRCVFSSTIEVQIGQDWTRAGMAVVDEHTPPNPDTIYAASKYLCEQLGAYYFHRHGIEFIALRYMAFGEGTTPSLGLLSRKIMVSDVAAANLKAVDAPLSGYQVLNIGPETPLTNQDIQAAMVDPFQVIEKHWPGATEVLQGKGVKVQPTHFWPVTRIHRAKEILGWQPDVTFATYIDSLK